MKLISIGKVLYIREIGKEKTTSGVTVEMPEAADGARLLVYRRADGKYYSSYFKSGACEIPRDFLQDGSYRLEYTTPCVGSVFAEFECRRGELLRARRSEELERAELWEAIITLYETLTSKEEKIERVIDGYDTE